MKLLLFYTKKYSVYLEFIKRIFCFFIVLILYSNCSHAQTSASLHFERIDPLLGLTNQNITDINQCDSGYLWLTTENGLFKFGGSRFEAFQTRSENGRRLINDVGHTINKHENLFWVGLRQHFCLLNPSTDKIKNISIKFSDAFPNHFSEFFGVKQFNDSIVYAYGPPGIFIYNKKQNKFRKWALPRQNIKQEGWVVDIVKIGNKLAISTWWHGIYLYDLTTKEFSNYLKVPTVKGADPILGRLFPENDSLLWISTWNQGLLVLNINSGKTKGLGFHFPNSGFSFFGGGPLLFDGDSTWICSRDEGLFLLDKKTGLISNFKNNPSDPNSLPYNYVTSIFKDSNGLIWIGTQRGLAKLNLKNQYLKSYNLKAHFNTDSIAVNEVLTAVKLQSDVFLVGNYQGFYGINGDKYFNLVAQLPEQKNLYPSKLQRFDSLYFLGYAGGFLTFNTQVLKDSILLKNLRKHEIPYCNSVVNNIWKRDSWNKNYLLTTRGDGVFCFNRLIGEIKPLDTLLNNVLRGLTLSASFYLPNDELLILGTRTNDVIFYSLKEKKFKHYTPENWPGEALTYPIVTGIVALDAKRVYLATDYGGIYIFENNKFTKDRKLNVSSTRIKKMLLDDSNKLLLLTDNGIDVFDIERNNKLHIGASNGITAPHFMYAFHFQDNYLLTSETYKFYEINLNNLTQPASEEHFLIRQISIDNTPIPFDGKTIVLKPHQSALEIAFEKLSLTSFQHRYRYRLDANKPWQNLGTNNHLFLTGLQNGSFVIELQASDIYGNWHDKIHEIPIYKNPYFFQTYWFIIAVSCFLLALVIGWYRLKINKLRALHKIRNQIALDLHDDIGSSLSSINLYSKIMLHNEDLNQNKPMLETISAKAAEVLDAVQDIVWTVNPQNDTLAVLINRIRFNASESLERLGIELYFEVKNDFSDSKIDLIAKRNLILLVKEIINNIAKHAEANMVWITIEQNQKNISLTVKDNGIGFNVEVKNQGNGLKNMQKRAQEMQSKISLTSSVGAGTQINLLLPIT